MKVLCILFLFIFCNLIADGEEVATVLSRSNNIPKESTQKNDDEYFEGYLQALIDMHYYEYKVVVMVKDGNVWLANMPKNSVYANSIITFLKDVPGVKKVVAVNGVPPEEVEIREKYVNRPKVKGIWFPQATELYQPMIANPRQVIYSFGYRGGDKVAGRTSIAFSMGDDFPVFRWLDINGGDLQIGIEAGIWSVFDMKPAINLGKGTAMFNTDYTLAIPVSYAKNQWSFRFRIYHISSHLGDEFLVNHPQYARVNPSFEAFDIFTSYQVNNYLRFYFGPGVILHSDHTFPMKHYYVEYGADASFWGTRIYYHRLFGTFFTAVYFRNWQLNDMNIDGTYMLGYEWSKLQGVGKKIRLYGFYHHGYSPDGQFMNKRTTYYGFSFAYGF
ncbi:MAG: hypothetical protein K1060chlam5_00066 [Candidatus Anoxychlamydiales bacterium]|nr:hypothetical protein [Candidatus Anoxychlamydiales bacterium]